MDRALVGGSVPELMMRGAAIVLALCAVAGLGGCLEPPPQEPPYEEMCAGPDDCAAGEPQRSARKPPTPKFC